VDHRRIPRKALQWLGSEKTDHQDHRHSYSSQKKSSSLWERPRTKTETSELKCMQMRPGMRQSIVEPGRAVSKGGKEHEFLFPGEGGVPMVPMVRFLKSLDTTTILSAG
jgi:hypothetical protein